MTRKAMYGVLVLATIFALGTAFARGSNAQPTPENVTVSGLVSCSSCILPNACKAQTRLSCTLDGINHGASFVLVTDDHKVYRLSGAEKDLMKFAGDSVTVTGELSGTELAVATVGKATSGKHER